MKQKILIVDDDKSISIGFGRIFENHGYEVYLAHSTKQAVKLLRTKKIDLAILDFIMPDMDGVALCQYIRKKMKLKAVRIILLTGYLVKESLQKAEESGIDKCVVKPVNSKILLAMAKSLLKKG